MLHTFHIDDSNSKAKALLEYLRTLEFVKEDPNDWGKDISKELESSILEGLRNEKNDEIIPHETVMSELRKEFPHLGL